MYNFAKYSATYHGEPSSKTLNYIDDVLKQCETLTGTIKEIVLADIEKRKKELVLERNAEHLISKELGYSPFGHDVEFWDYLTDMTKISKKYPDCVFKIECQEGMDMWATYLSDGKSQHAKAKMVYDDFNPDELMEVPETYQNKEEEEDEYFDEEQ